MHPQGHPLEGRRVFRRAFFSRPKGRAKSELAGAICCVESLGPVSFDGWDANGDPVGRPIVSPLVRCFATEENQAGNTFDNAYYMLGNGTAYDEYPGLDIGISRINLPDGGEIVALTSKASSKDGGKDTFDVFDETHLWVLPDLKRLHATVTRNLIKRKIADGWALETSTMYAPGEESVAEQTHASAKAVPTVLFDHREAPADIDIHNDKSLRKGLEYVYGSASEWTNIDGIISDFRDPQTRESDNRRYWLNQPVVLEEKFVSADEWDNCADATRTIADGSRVVLALDGSFNNDSTFVSLVSHEEIPHVEVLGAWERPENAREGWEVDILDVEATILEAAKRFKIVELTGDPYRWARTLQAMADKRINTSEFPQTAARMAPATKRLHDLIVTKQLTHSGDVRLRRHILNAVVKDDARGYRLVKDAPNSMNKIDGAVTTAMAVDRAAVTPRRRAGRVVNLADFV